MIAAIRGTLLSKTTTQVIVDVQGVGYLLNVTPNSVSALQIGADVSMHTVLVVREDALTLFGFQSTLEQELFDLLRSVTGVGPKSALAILGSLSPSDIASAVALDNDSVFKSVSGIGPKTAKLITVTLAGKLGHLVGVSSSTKSNENDFSSVIEALVSLGWPERAATDAVQEAEKESPVGTGQDGILRLALAVLGGSKSKSVVK